MTQKRTQEYGRNCKYNIVHDQKGFSLVELVVVIAIMGVLAVGGLLSMSLVFGQNIKSCYKELESYLQQTRMMAMSRADATLKIYTKVDGVYVYPSVENREIKIGKVGISVSYHDTNGNTVDVTGATELEISFDRSSGAFKPISISSGVSNYCDMIKLTDGDRTYQLKLAPKTGKFYLD